MVFKKLAYKALSIVMLSRKNSSIIVLLIISQGIKQFKYIIGLSNLFDHYFLYTIKNTHLSHL